MSGFNEIYEFGEVWRDTQNFNVTPIGNYVFVADVIYESPSRGTEVQSCTVQIFRNGAPDGNIEIYSKGRLQPESHHLGFTARFQTYTFDRKSQALVVTGNSPKMGGAYKATLSPNGAEPSFSS